MFHNQQKEVIPVGKEIFIVNKLNNQVITISEGQYNTKKGELIVQKNTNLYSQKFMILEKNSSSKFYLIQSTSSKTVLQIKRGKTEEYLQATMDKLDGDNNQIWRIIPCNVSWNQHDKNLKNVKPSMLGYDSEQKIKQIVSKMGYSNQNASNQGYFFIQNVKSEQVLQIEGGIDAQGMNVVQNKNYGNRNQKWKFI